jgi:hypothetical protein
MFLLAMLACKEEPLPPAAEPIRDTDVSEPAPTYMDPVAVGFEFDGIVHADGTLSGYWYEDEYYEPTVFVVFVSQEFFAASSEEVDTDQSCWAWGTWDPQPEAVDIPTYDGASLYSSYEDNLTIDWHTCADVLDPDEWGVDGEDLIYAFQEIHLGVGFAPLTVDLESAWNDATVDDLGDAMFSSYFAFNDADGGWVAEDLTTSFSWAYDADTESLRYDDEGYLVPEPIVTSFPEMYVLSSAIYYVFFDDLDFDGLHL